MEKLTENNFYRFPHFISDQGFKVNVVNRTLRGSFEITITISLQGLPA